MLPSFLPSFPPSSLPPSLMWFILPLSLFFVVGAKALPGIPPPLGVINRLETAVGVPPPPPRACARIRLPAVGNPFRKRTPLILLHFLLRLVCLILGQPKVAFLGNRYWLLSNGTKGNMTISEIDYLRFLKIAAIYWTGNLPWSLHIGEILKRATYFVRLQ